MSGTPERKPPWCAALRRNLDLPYSAPALQQYLQAIEPLGIHGRFGKDRLGPELAATRAETSRPA